MHNDRHNEIMRIISLRKRASVGELTERLGVSEVTIRKDLGFLEEMGYLVRTRGAATLAEDWENHRVLGIRREEHVDDKRAVAAAAMQLVQEGDTIYLDSGSTCALLAGRLSGMTLRVVTNSIDVVLELGDAPGIALHSVGGTYRKEAGSFIGPAAIEALASYHIDEAFLGTTGFSRDGDFSAQNLIEAQLKKAVIGRARRVVVLADHSKFGARAFAVFAKLADIDIVVMDDFPGRAEVTALGCEVIFAPVGSTAGHRR
ncbi:MAG TPA: DeoR/GlpR family DNA-binding transcription regulator [Spirochaetia bacterium]|nr:DeoR/GlpR family DNA-binding transcription regulator [Spirochaetia bacterium]